MPFGIGARKEGGSPLFRAGARIAAQRGDEKQALDLIESGLERAVREGAAKLTLGLLQERAWLYRNRSRTDQAEGLALLGEYARRHQDRPAQLQHLAQSIDADGAAQGDPSALGYLLSHADPEDAWGLVPALWPAVTLALRTQEEALLVPLQFLIQAQTSPFRFTVFPDPVSQSALDALLFTGSDPGTGAFAEAFLRLCETWPYRILLLPRPTGGARAAVRGLTDHLGDTHGVQRIPDQPGNRRADQGDLGKRPAHGAAPDTPGRDPGRVRDRLASRAEPARPVRRRPRGGEQGSADGRRSRSPC